MCEGLQAKVEQLLKREKWLTDRNYELGQKLSSLYLSRTTFHNGHYELIQEEEEEPHSLAFNCQRRVHVANMKVELFEEQMMQKEKEFQQDLQMERQQHLSVQNKCIREVQLQKKRLDETVKNLTEEVNDLRQYKSLATANIEKIKREAELDVMTYKTQFYCEKKNFTNYKKQMVNKKEKLLKDMEHTIKKEAARRIAVCKEEMNALKDKNKELSNQLREAQLLQAHTLCELDSVKLRFNQHLITSTMQENSLISSQEIQTKLGEKERKLTDMNDSKDLQIIHLKNLITELKENNNEVNERRERLHQKWQKALAKGGQQAAMIQEMQDDSRLKAGKNSAICEELVVVQEQYSDSSNQLKNVKWQLAERSKALDLCVTSAANERALGEKKMAEMAAEMAAEKEELEEELQRHKELLEDKQMEKVQVANEQLRQKRPLVKNVNKTRLPQIPKQPPPSGDLLKVQVQLGEKLKDTRFPFLKKSTIQPKETSQARPASSNLPASLKSKKSAPRPTQISSQTPSNVDKKTEKSVRLQPQKSQRVLGACVTDNEQALGKKKMAEMGSLKITPVRPTSQARPASSNLLTSWKSK